MKKTPVVFVTGATGFIGSHLVRRLLKESYNTHILYRTTTSSSRLDDMLSKTTKHNVDICNKKSLEKLLKRIKPDYIFHLANIGIYGGKESPDEDVVNVNFLGTVNLIQSSKDIPYKFFVNTGSSSEYGRKNKKMKEDDSCFPESMYGITKLASTLYAQNFAKKTNKPVLTLRLFSPYGSYDDPNRFISTIIKQALANKEIRLTYPKNVRDYIFVDDVINAYISCIKNGNKLSGEIINVGSGKQHTIEEVLNTVTKLIHTKSRVVKDDTITRYESVIWQADITKAKNLLDWRPTTTLEDGLKQTIEWYKQNY